MTRLSHFRPHLARWGLVADGAPIRSEHGALLPVRAAGRPAMLKVSKDPQERVGATLMEWWGGEGAARVLAREGDALLMERAMGVRSLAEMARSGDDAAACRILCEAALRLQAARKPAPPALTPLRTRFHDLRPAAAARGGILRDCAAAARSLLAEPRQVTVLHGDLHHGNVLDFGARGWLAIDPKGLVGEWGFELANLFCNPDLSDPWPPVAVRPAVFSARLALVTELAGLERSRLLRWILAWTGLSATWILAGGGDPSGQFEVARLAAAELGR